MIKRLFASISFSALLISCSTADDPVPQLSAYDLSVISYFKEIALGFEFGNASNITRRWEIGMKVFVGGNPTPELLTELDKIIGEINTLSTTGFKIETVSDTLQSNFYIFFGTGADYAKIFPSQSELVNSNYGLFSVFWNGLEQINRGYMYVDLVRPTATEQRHLLREELTQSLGLARDSYTYPESIFQQSYSTKVTEYAQIDKDLVRRHKHLPLNFGKSSKRTATAPSRGAHSCRS